MKKNGLTGKTVWAYVPFANFYFLAVAIGEEENAILYTVALLIPIANIVAMAVLWMKVAKVMGKEEVVGILVALLPSVLPLIGSLVSLYLVYDIANSSPVAASEPKKKEAKEVTKNKEEKKTEKKESKK